MKSSPISIMNADFELSHTRLSADPRFAALAGRLDHESRIDSNAAFNRYCRLACLAWKEAVGRNAPSPSPFFAELVARLARHDEGTIPTSWGGVVVTLHEHPRVEKFLVIRQGGYLALEKHAEKDEQLEVREGAGLLLSRHAADEPLFAEALEPGGRFHFAPGMEHCIIGTEDLLVFERSTDPKGMDQDLIFLYEPDGAA